MFVPQEPGKIENDPEGAGEFKEPNEPPKKEVIIDEENKENKEIPEDT